MSSPTVVPPAGTSPVGAFLLEEHTGPGSPPAMLADPVDPKTGEYLSISRSFDPTDGAVLTALSIERGSGSAVQNVGQRFRDATHITPQLSSFFQQEVAQALRHLTASKQIRLESVTVVTEDDTVNLYVRYVNLARQQKRLAVLPLGQFLQEAA